MERRLFERANPPGGGSAIRPPRVDAVGAVVGGNASPTTTYDYDAAGNLDHVRLPNGDVTDYDYDDLNRLNHLTTTNASSFKLFEQDYTLQHDGQRESVLEKRYSGSSGTPFSTVDVGWTYDDLARLTSETRDAGATGQDGEDYVDTFAYDLAGNRLSRVFNSANNAHDETVAYAYDARDRLTAEDSDVNAHDVGYTYDLNGSMTQRITGTSGSTTTARYLWDLRNRMAAVDGNGDDLSINSTTGVTSGTVNDASDVTYAYDDASQRVSQKVGNASASRYYLNDSGNPTGYPQIVEERTGTTAAVATFDRSNVIGQAVLGQYDATNGTLYLLTDGHGSTRALLNPNGTVGDTYDYQAFGDAIGFTAATAKTNHLFGGDAEFDSLSNLYYHDKRWRQNFRFVSTDDYEGNPSDPLSLHRYLYTHDNSVNAIDPSGNFELSLVGILSTVGLGSFVQSARVQQVLNQTQTALDIGTAVGTGLQALQWANYVVSDAAFGAGPLAAQAPSAGYFEFTGGVAIPLLASTNVWTALGISHAGPYFAATFDIVSLASDPANVYFYWSTQFGLATAGTVASVEAGVAWHVDSAADFSGNAYSSFGDIKSF